MDDACDAQDKAKGLCCAYHHSLFGEEGNATAVRKNECEVRCHYCGKTEDAVGFEGSDIQWDSKGKRMECMSCMVKPRTTKVIMGGKAVLRREEP